MRRVLFLSATVAITGLAGLGCKNATHGRCDCMYDPANTQLAQPGNPYPTVGKPVTSAAPATAMPAPTPAPAPAPATLPPMAK